MVKLRPVTPADLPRMRAWYAAIDARQYMSRWGPHGFDHQHVPDPGVCRWYIISVEENEIGSVWLEMEEPGVARLGILIGVADALGKGFGREAIRQAIRMASHGLSFTTVRLRVRKSNARALACYRACGFQPVKEETVTRSEGVTLQVVVMEKTLD